MINLKHEVQRRGYKVAHIKTDSIKIPDADLEIIRFVTDYGKKYGYIFEHEATYDRMTLVNDAVYIAKYATVEHCCELYGEAYVNQSKDVVKDCKKHGGQWTATGTQFQIPYVFKKLFSHEEIEFRDMCETKSVSSALYLDMNEGMPDVSELERVYSLRKSAYIQLPDGKRFLDAETPKKDQNLLSTWEHLTDGDLASEIAKGHNYVFIGKVGQFCPMKDSFNGGILLRETTSKTGEKGYAAATGSKGYRWLESEMVKSLGKENGIDRSYYDAMVDTAANDISKYGDFEWFVSDDPYIPQNTPPWFGAGDPHEEDSTPFDVR